MRRWTSNHLPRPWKLLLFLGIGLFLYALAAFVTPARATASAQEEQPTNDFCLACHQQEGVELTLGSESLPVTINPTQFGLSVHNEEGVQCVDCHANIREYPHPAVTEKSV